MVGRIGKNQHDKLIVRRNNLISGKNKFNKEFNKYHLALLVQDHNVH